ncbi:MAG: adenosine kinase [Fibrobacter sp.]|nr:adenosine kinase [Fibrobacter sp.]
MKKVLGFGAALVDMVAQVDDAWIHKVKLSKGGQRSVDYPALKSVLDQIHNAQRVPGGAACNTMVGVAKLGGKSSFLAKVGRDELGELYAKHLTDSGVENFLLQSWTETGTVLSAVTPDAERTMLTFLGASNEVVPSEIHSELFDGVGIVYLEGYRAYSEDCFVKMIQEARKRGVMTALDFGAFGVVNDCRSLFDKLFAGKEIDIVIANEDEAKVYTGESEEAALEKLAQLSKIAVVKLGKRGALISKDGVMTRVPCGPAKAIDTTGAGDLWASGFLYGILSGWDMERSGKLGSIVSNEVVQVIGAQIPEEGWARIHEEMKHV